jgi:hypothetical protein
MAVIETHERRFFVSIDVTIQIRQFSVLKLKFIFFAHQGSAMQVKFDHILPPGHFSEISFQERFTLQRQSLGHGAGDKNPSVGIAGCRPPTWQMAWDFLRVPQAKFKGLHYTRAGLACQLIMAVGD